MNNALPTAAPKPPQDGHWGLPVALALGVHALLVAALTWGVAWQQTQVSANFDVELWSDIPIAAAPPPPEPKPQPEPEPTPEPPAPEPEPTPEPAPPPEPPGPSAADIALEQQRALEAQQQLEAAKLAKEKAAKEKAAREKAARERAAKEKAAKELAEKKAAQQRAREEKALKDKLRQEQLARLSNLAGTAGQTGDAAKASGPSASYAGKVVGAIRPNIVFTDVVAGNPGAEVEVTTRPTGEILGRTLRKSSGMPAWDEAVLRAIDRTATLPRDTNGRVPSPMLIRFRPKD
ncbi:cell envelope integrity protein TolA [Comamonadaceae bacterium M7527]|nr:cell envelope integrity protein TolA [Comamonadaceae bacterium M7527]